MMEHNGSGYSEYVGFAATATEPYKNSTGIGHHYRSGACNLKNPFCGLLVAKAAKSDIRPILAAA